MENVIKIIKGINDPWDRYRCRQTMCKIEKITNDDGSIIFKVVRSPEMTDSQYAKLLETLEYVFPKNVLT